MSRLSPTGRSGPPSRLFTAAQMREADRQALDSGISLHTLMHNAGLAVARQASCHFPHISEWFVLTGPGNNGGDGWVAALELSQRGMKVSVCELFPHSDLPAAAARARQTHLTLAGAVPLSVTAMTTALRAAPSGTIGLVDALFGSGLSRPLEGDVGELVSALNASAAAVVAIDVPSGLNSDLAQSGELHVAADLTVALAGFKPAHLFEPARSSCGTIALVDIGIPERVLKTCSSTVLLQPQNIAHALPQLSPAGHKYDAGAVCLVAGSERYRGAAELAARAAWRSGAGLVTLVSDGVHPNAWPETIFQRHEFAAAWPPAGLTHKRAAALLIGPGMESASLSRLPEMLDWATGPVVLDAGALDPGVLDPAVPQLSKQPTVLTPHAGEAAALLAHFLPEHGKLVATDPLQAAASLADELQVTVVLKGPATVIAGSSGELAVSTRGHPAMATGGTGDVLAGVISALLARANSRSSLFDLVSAAVVLHGTSGELAAERTGDGTVASDVVDQLPAAAAYIRDFGGA